MADHWFLSGDVRDMHVGFQKYGLDDLAAYLVHTWQSDPHLFDTIPHDLQVDLKQGIIRVRNPKEWKRTDWHVWRKQVPDFWYAAYVYWVRWSTPYHAWDSTIYVLHDLTLQFVGLQTVYQKAYDLLLQTEFLVPDLVRIVGNYLGLP